jgi:UDP-glucose 4-epimerase
MSLVPFNGEGRLIARGQRRLGGRSIGPRPNGARIANVLKGKRVLVTGGAGFVGSHVVELLVTAGCSEIIVIDNMSKGRPENLVDSIRSGKVHLVIGDIRNQLLLKELLDRVDTVFHQAELPSTYCAAEPRAALEVMVDATFHLLEQCDKSGVRKIVMASSAAVYGMPDSFPTTELHNSYSNRTLYGTAKSFGEGLLRSFNSMYGLNYVALRYFDVYGPRMDVHGRHTEALVRWMERIDSGLPPIIFGNGDQTVDLLHVEDVARANVLAATSPASDVALNVASGEETSLLQLARLVSRAMGRPDLEPTFWQEGQVNPVLRRWADTNAARRTIGFEANIPLALGMTSLVDWWRNKSTARQGVLG